MNAFAENNQRNWVTFFVSLDVCMHAYKECSSFQMELMKETGNRMECRFYCNKLILSSSQNNWPSGNADCKANVNHFSNKQRKKKISYMYVV